MVSTASLQSYALRNVTYVMSLGGVLPSNQSLSTRVAATCLVYARYFSNFEPSRFVLGQRKIEKQQVQRK